MKKHRVLAVIFGILFFLSLLSTTILGILQTTILNENFVKENLQKSDVVSKGIDGQINKSLTGDVIRHINADDLKLKLKDVLKPDIENVIIQAIYHPQTADNAVRQMQGDITKVLNGQVKSNDPIVNSIVSTAVSSLSQQIHKSIVDKIHYNELKKIGAFISGFIPQIKYLLIASVVLALLSFIILFAIGRIKTIVVFTIITAALIGAIGLLIYSIEGLNLVGLKEFIGELRVCLGIRFMTVAGIEAGAAIVLGIISAIISKRIALGNR